MSAILDTVHPPGFPENGLEQRHQITLASRPIYCPENRIPLAYVESLMVEAAHALKNVEGGECALMSVQIILRPYATPVRKGAK